MQLEFGEQSLDLVPFAFRAGIRGGLRQLPGRLPCRFMPVNEDPPSRSASTTLLYGAASALRLRGLIKVALCLVVHSTVAQCLALRTAKDIFDLVVLKLITSEVPMRLVASIDHRDIRLDASLQQPRQKLPTAVGLIRAHTLGTDAEPLFHSFEHA